MVEHAMRVIAGGFLLLFGLYLAYGVGAGYIFQLPPPLSQLLGAVTLGFFGYAAWKLRPRARSEAQQ